MTKLEFIEKIGPLVQKYAPQYNIKVCSPIIAQAVLESAGGTSNKVSIKKSNGVIEWRHNYFGLKWRNNRCAISNSYFTETTQEQNPDGTYVTISSRFCKFNSLEDCVIGYFQWTNISNYANLKGVTDPKTYLENIKADGYATSLKYVDDLMNVIKSYNLTRFDTINKPNETKEDKKMGYLTAIDSGHGSNTAGKRHPDGYREHYSNTYTAFYLNQILNQNGIDTIKIGWDDNLATDDVDTPLTDRQKTIKKAGCLYSISVHANAHGDGNSYTSGQGIETLIHNRADSVGDSRRLAELVQKELIKGTSQKNRGVKTMALSMCNCKTMGTKASILIEMAFMTNKYESDILKQDAYWRETAKEIATGFFNYIGIKGNVNVPLVDALTGKAPAATTTPTVTPSTTPTTTTTNTSNGVKKGAKVTLKMVKCYKNSSTTIATSIKSGTFYLWDDAIVNGRIKITNAANRVGVAGQVTGWVNVVDTGLTTTNTSTNSTVKNIKTGDKLMLNKTPLYTSSSATTTKSTRTGTFYVWSNTAVNGKIRITNAANRVGVPGQITGWIDLKDI